MIYNRLKEKSYAGGITQIRVYIESHKDLVPAPREVVSPLGNCGRRYATPPGDSYQMDWGFVNVEMMSGEAYRLACFVMVCHYCGLCSMEFFTNARQENLFIGMIHAFQMMGVPRYILTDNMKSVVVGRSPPCGIHQDGCPVSF